MNKSAEDRERAEKDAYRNRQRNERHIEKLGAHTRKLTRGDLKRMKLHEMQGGECLYTGKAISMERLFDGSVEVDHILPREITRDDGISNLALAYKEANQFKGKRAPFQAFSTGYDGQDYAHILKRAWRRGKGVYWRFKENAMERFADADAFRARYLNDTRYVGKMAARYLAAVCRDPNGVVCLNGRITSDLRREWQLGSVIAELMIEDGRLSPEDISRSRDGETLEELRVRRNRMDKIRWDSRHHLLDAIVAACTTRSDVHRLQTLPARDTAGATQAEILSSLRRADPEFRNVGMCWKDGFRCQVMDFLRNRNRGGITERSPIVAVVPKTDHDPSGQLHMETNYGVICQVPGTKSQYVARSHVKLKDLGKKQIEELKVPDTALAAVEEAMRIGAPIWWGGADPLTALRANLAPELKAMRARLLALMDETPQDRFANVTTEGGRDKVRAAWAVEAYTRETGRRRYTRIEVLSLRILKGPADHKSKPKRANATRGNDRLVYFVNPDGERDWEVVSTLDANTPGFRERWRRDGGRHLFTIRKDDLVEMEGAPGARESVRRIYRTVSLSPGDLEFLPVEESRSPKEVPPGTRVRISSLRAFTARRPVMVLCDPTGRERWRGPRTN